MMIGWDLTTPLSVLAETNWSSRRCCDSSGQEGVNVVPLLLLLPGARHKSASADAMVKVETHVEFNVGIGIK